MDAQIQDFTPTTDLRPPSHVKTQDNGGDGNPMCHYKIVYNMYKCQMLTRLNCLQEAGAVLPRGPGPSLHHQPLPEDPAKVGAGQFYISRWRTVYYICSLVLDPTTVGVQVVRLGCYSGFWGNIATAMPQLVNGGNIQCLVTARKKPCPVSLRYSASRLATC